LREPRDELLIVLTQPDEGAALAKVRRCGPVSECGDLVGVSFHATFTDYVSKERDSALQKATFGRLQFQVCIPQAVKQLPQAVDVLV